MHVDIIEYQEHWPDEFRIIAGDLREALESLAIRIDHIGSTAVPGLSAKDVIDIQVTATALDSPLLTALNGLGYSVGAGGIWYDHTPPLSVHPKDQWQKLFFRAPAEQRRTNLHVRIDGNANARFALLFRDYLRQHNATAQAYAELKRSLAANLRDPELYPEVKDPAVDLIYLAAEDWATVTSWESGPSDA